MKILTPILFSIFLVPTMLFTATTAYSQEANIISVTGTGVAKMEVDTAFVNGAVVTQSKVVADAQAANAKIFKAAREDVMMKFQLGEKDFVSTGYDISRVYKYPPNASPVLIGYSVRHSFQVRISKLDDLGAVIDHLGTHGVNLVESISFSGSDRKKYELEALALAMQDAQAKADVIARSTGRAIKQVLKVNYEPAYVPNESISREVAEEKQEAGTEIAPGDLEVVANVSVVYQF
jgi:uncharacterized protein